MSQSVEASATAPTRPLLRVASIASWLVIAVIYAAAFRNQPHILYGFLCLIVGGFVGTLVHEAGHAIAAIVFGWRVIAIVVRPFAWQIPNRNFTVVPRSFRNGFGGWVVTVPQRVDDQEQVQWSRILAAGPFFSFLLAAAAFLAVPFLPSISTFGAYDSKGIAFGFALQSLHMFAFAILPSAQRGVTSDGDKWRASRKAGNSYSLNRSIIWLSTLLAYKVRLRALPTWMVSEAQESSAPLEGGPTFLDSLKIGQIMDAETVDTILARRLIDQFRATHGPSEWLSACDAYLAAMWEVDVNGAKAALAERDGSPATTPIFLAAEAAVAARMGDRKLAQSKLKAMWKTQKHESPFADQTFRDIRDQINGVLR